MAKVRVYELAKELGVESKTVLSMLKDMGEFVRSASSTVEAPVERRLKEKLASEPPPVKKTTTKKAAAAKRADAEPATPTPVAAKVSAEAPAVTAPAAPPAAAAPAIPAAPAAPAAQPPAPAAPAAQFPAAPAAQTPRPPRQLKRRLPQPQRRLRLGRRGQFRVRACPVRPARLHPLRGRATVPRRGRVRDLLEGFLAVRVGAVLAPHDRATIRSHPRKEWAGRARRGPAQMAPDRPHPDRLPAALQCLVVVQAFLACRGQTRR